MADLILVDTATAWRWRCQSEGTVIPGAALCVGSALTRLAECRSIKVDAKDLLCSCGGRVIPLSPIEP
jgi:hypothetical protein